jgi:uncharacterized protein YegL
MTVDYVNNPNQRTPCVLILDASYSMSTKTSSGKTRIQLLNEGLQEFEKALKSDSTALTRVQVSIVLVGGPNSKAELLMDWTDANYFTAFNLKEGGNTPLAEGLEIGLDLVETSKVNLRQNGISYTRPWMFVMSDGEPTSDRAIWKKAAENCKRAINDKKLMIFPIGIDSASGNAQKLNEISDKPCLNMEGTKFNEFFVWLSDSLSAVTRSRPGDTIELPETDPWRHVGI